MSSLEPVRPFEMARNDRKSRRRVAKVPRALRNALESFRFDAESCFRNVTKRLAAFRGGVFRVVCDDFDVRKGGVALKFRARSTTNGVSYAVSESKIEN